MRDSRPTLSDNGNAQRLVRDHGRDLRFVPAWGRWIVWNGARWISDATGEVVRRAKQVVAGIYSEAARASDSEREALGKHALRSEQERAIRAMISLAESEPDVPVTPDQLDADPMLLNVENGALDLRTCLLRQHNRSDLITKLAPVRFDPAATHPAWDAFLSRMVPNPEVQAFLRRAVGYSLTGDTTEEKLFFLHGPTAAGKSTFTGAVSAALGDYAATCDFETFLRKRGDGGVRNDIARLAGIRMALSLEVDEGRALAEALVKTITGGDVITARFLYQESFEFKPTLKLWLASNDKPRANAGDGALWRRILLVPFEVSLPESERDPAVKETLMKDQDALAAILAWGVRGLREWREIGLRPPAAVRRATDAYREEQDTVAPFLSDCCLLEPGAFVTTKALRAAYDGWCAENREKPLSGNVLATRLRDHRCKSGTSRDHAKARGWSGVRLRNLDDPADAADTADTDSDNLPLPRTREDFTESAVRGVRGVRGAPELVSPTPPADALEASNGSGVESDPLRPSGAILEADARELALRLADEVRGDS